jgi:simple sugar transport system permease protein
VRAILPAIPVRLEKRTDRTPRWVQAATPVGAFLFAFVIVTIILLAGGHNPLQTYNAMLQASVTSTSAISQTLVSATPLVLTGLAAAVAFRMGIWNISCTSARSVPPALRSRSAPMASGWRCRR